MFPLRTLEYAPVISPLASVVKVTFSTDFFVPDITLLSSARLVVNTSIYGASPIYCLSARSITLLPTVTVLLYWTSYAAPILSSTRVSVAAGISSLPIFANASPSSLLSLAKNVLESAPATSVRVCLSCSRVTSPSAARQKPTENIFAPSPST